MGSNTLLPCATLTDAIRIIELNPKRMAIVVDEYNYLLGTITDGDIRRHILNGHSLDAIVTEAMNENPITSHEDMSPSRLQKVLLDKNIRGIPLVDKANKYLRVLYRTNTTDNLDVSNETTFSTAVIMAGGQGLRLRPLTKTIPKPMIEINGVSLLERQVLDLKAIGVLTIYISVNYLKDVIKSHFGNGTKFGVSIKYLNESKKLGTAGALSLMPKSEIVGPVLVMNGDILTTINLSHLYHFFQANNSEITIAATDYEIQVPYGVIKNDGVNVISIQEKPSQRFFCNAGIYALSSKVINDIPLNKFFNMTDVIEKCICEGANVTVFPLHEYWTDIGTPKDLDHANDMYKEYAK